jgi:hypothetical protein
MAEVSQYGQMSSRLDDLLEEVKKIICISIAQKAIGPIGQSLRSNTYRLNMSQILLEKGLQISFLVPATSSP